MSTINNAMNIAIQSDTQEEDKDIVLFDPTPGTSDDYLSKIADSFNPKLDALHTRMQTALAAVKGDATDPATLAEYQSAVSAWTVMANAQSTTIKSIKDLDSLILSKF